MFMGVFDADIGRVYVPSDCNLKILGLKSFIIGENRFLRVLVFKVKLIVFLLAS